MRRCFISKNLPPLKRRAKLYSLGCLSLITEWKFTEKENGGISSKYIIEYDAKNLIDDLRFDFNEDDCNLLQTI